MQRSNVFLLRNNLSKWLNLNLFSTNLEDYNYKIILDPSDTKEISSNIEQIMNFRILPKFLNKTLGEEEAFELLVTGYNEIPLWIGVEVNHKMIKLVISKRFKKWRVANEWHKNNPTIPFIDIQKLSPAPNKFKEFHVLYPTKSKISMQCKEFEAICSAMVLEEVMVESIEERIAEHIEYEDVNVLMVQSKEYVDQYMLVDLWNQEGKKTVDLFFRTNGAINNFVQRSLNSWNNKLWKGKGPRVTEVELGQLERLKESGRKIETYNHDS